MGEARRKKIASHVSEPIKKPYEKLLIVGFGGRLDTMRKVLTTLFSERNS